MKKRPDETERSEAHANRPEAFVDFGKPAPAAFPNFEPSGSCAPLRTPSTPASAVDPDGSH